MKNLAALIVTALLFAFSMSVMAGPYTLSITQPENGRISVSPVKEYYEAGDIITFTAIPDSGYTFSEFTYNGTPYLDNPLVVSPTRDMELSVEFVYSGYTIKVTPTEAGTVTIDPLKATYTKGEPVTITATPNEGAIFDGFYGTISTDESTLLIYVDQDYDLTAYFHYLDFSITVAPSTGGELTLDPDKGSYLYNEEVSYTAKPYEGYRFDKIEGYLEELTESTGTITIKSDYYLVPIFVPEEYLVTVSPSTGGTITLDPEKLLYGYGDEVTVIADPEPGLALDTLLVNGKPIEGDFFTVTGPTEVQALFSLAPEEPAGFGTEDEPYEIASASNLIWMSKHSDISEGQFFVLTSNIDLSDSSYWRDGQGFPPIGTEEFPFMGTFTGRGYCISNLYICTDSTDPQGLFGYASDALIQNFTLTGYVKGEDEAALLIGLADNVQVYYVTLSGDVQGSYGAALLAGYAFGGTYQYCSALGSAKGNQFVAGLIGKADSVIISDCLTDVSASGDSLVGGIVGEVAYSTLSNCLALGSSKATQYDRGGIAGSPYQSTATACFFDSRKAASNKFGTGINQKQIADQATYTGWDFLNVWEFLSGANHPSLRPTAYFFWTQIPGESQATFSFSCTLTDSDIAACNNTIFIYNGSDLALIVPALTVPTLPVKDPLFQIKYNAKKQSLKYTTASTYLTIGSFDGSLAWPFLTNNNKQKFAFTLTAQEDLTPYFNKSTYICLADPGVKNHALSFTTIELTQKGNNLSYQGTQNGVTLKVKINTKNKKCTLKATFQNTISLVTSPYPEQQ